MKLVEIVTRLTLHVSLLRKSDNFFESYFSAIGERIVDRADRHFRNRVGTGTRRAGGSRCF